jgi:glycosyltransferase involved in cell wall biosynthesis
LTTVRESRPENLAPVILFVGMVRADKGVDTLIEAAACLQQQNRKFRIRIVGEFASDQYHRELVREIKDLGLSNYIELCGRKVELEKWTTYRRADIFCFPTYYAPETFGNVLLEAMMFELPTVSTRWRAIPDIVVEGETGFLVEIKDSEALAEKLARLLDDKHLRLEMGRKGRERYLANFTTDIYLQRNREVFLEVARSPGSREAPAREPGDALFPKGRAEKTGAV